MHRKPSNREGISPNQMAINGELNETKWHFYS
uniref:Uncharacterized protein n=1 Tax=Rhizophora mucronata TaxID=61149 RepID=A0A2P2QG14_RHIMU